MGLVTAEKKWRYNRLLDLLAIQLWPLVDLAPVTEINNENNHLIFLDAEYYAVISDSYRVEIDTHYFWKFSRVFM